MRRIAPALLCLLTLLPTTTLAADYAREKRWADEVVPSVMVGDAVWLQDGPHKFLALFTPATDAKAAVIVVHGLGVHPDWGLIGVLRQQLAEQGYSTLSVQMPVLRADAKGDEYPPTFPEAGRRLRQAVAFLKEKGYARLAIVSHSLGSRMSHAFLSTTRAGDVNAWASIGASGTEDWSALKLPILDLYGGQDLPAVLKQVPNRAKALKQPGSRQVKVDAANHFFEGQDAALVDNVKAFLDEALK